MFVVISFSEEFTYFRTKQFGFRSGNSTTLQLRRVLNLITGAAERKHHFTLVLIDIQQSLRQQRMWQESILYKHTLSPLPGRMSRLFRNDLHHRTFSVSVSRSVSKSRPVSSGELQGVGAVPVVHQ
ncbi:uncharacterized protein LOC124369562 [Homalodisca vitripennis]|uniref:uncharacterized protein LOC124369562 n=1 Tax=Homalodisca vitripennis TaxID=197043 RepID=UPI001EEB3438|nr:uncharacterized protein LOC124369562 [Homalodisca vitripennis]